jgi:ectoine hydroxylase-related dioxygenase (phytanoyl-CoA dioxygenase family)
MSTPTYKAPFLRNISDFTVEDPTNTSEIISKYDEWGFVVIKNILSSSECEDAEKLLYEDLLQCIDKTNIKDEKLKSVYQDVANSYEHFPKDSLPGLASKGFLSLCGLPQGKFAWKLRTNPIVRKIYAGLHNCEEQELCVSLDVPFFTPDTYSREDCLVWSHADQNIHVKIGSPNSHQGILYVWDATKQGTSNTVVIPKSHKNEYFELLNAIPEHAYDAHNGIYITSIPDVKEKERLLKVWCEKSRRIPVPAGGLLIFNSRTIHQGYQNGLRLAQTVCWEPKIYRTEEALIKKLQACVMGIATTHWASLGIHHGVSFITPKLPKYVGNGKFHHRNIFPLKNIWLEPLTNEANEKQVKFGRPHKRPPTNRLDLLTPLIKPEFLNFL